MPITTLNEVKTILQLDDSYDSLINDLIPRVQESFFRYTHNYFLNREIQLQSSAFVFDKTAKTITEENSPFVSHYFVAGDYKIQGSVHNDGIKTVTNVAAGSLTLSAEPVDEDYKINSILITKIDYPSDVAIDVAIYIKWLLDKQGFNIKSESLPGGYSVTFKNEKEVVSSCFKKYKMPI